MNIPAKPRVVIAVRPRLLGSMMANVLTNLGTDEVVDREPGIPQGTGYDAALISGTPWADLIAEVIIELPDHEGNAGIGGIIAGHQTEAVVIDGPEAILGLLDRHCPARVRRVVNGGNRQ